MPAFYDNILRPHRANRVRGAAHLFEIRDFESAEDVGFVQVRRDDGREGQEQLNQRVPSIGAQQMIAAFGDHDRVNDQRREMMLANLGRDRRDNLCARQHARFHNVRANVVRNGINLERDKFWRNLEYALHADRVLGGQRRDCAHPEHAARGKRFQVGLDSRAAARV